MKKAIPMFIALLSIYSFSCSNERAPQSPSASTGEQAVAAADRAAPGEKKGTLLFFINPHGIPCQMQDRILSEALPSIRDTVDVRYVKTTNPADTETFYRYSIRGLPSMIIIDRGHVVLKRFTPGIQDADTITRAVKGL